MWINLDYNKFGTHGIRYETIFWLKIKINNEGYYKRIVRIYLINNVDKYSGLYFICG